MEGVTPLILASTNGHETTVEMLLKYGGANINNIDKYGNTAITIAANENIRELLKNYQKQNTVVMADVMLDQLKMNRALEPDSKHDLYEFIGKGKGKSNKRRKTKKRRRKTVKKQRKYKRA